MPIWIAFLAYSTAIFLWLLTPWIRKGLSWFLMWLWMDALKFRNFTVFRNLQIAFPQMPKEEKIKIAHQSLRNLADSFFAFLLLPLRGKSWMEKSVIFEGLDNFEKAKTIGGGVLGLSLHLGPGDVACAMLSVRGIPVNLISKKFKQKFLNQFWFGVRERMGTKFIDPHGRETPFQILSGLKKKELVIFVLDQFMGRPFGIPTKFFGRKTGTAYGLALFALKTKAPVLPLYCFWDSFGKLHVVFGQIISSEVKSLVRDQQILELTQRYNDTLEEIVKKHPEFWMWIHRRWKLWE